MQITQNKQMWNLSRNHATLAAIGVHHNVWWYMGGTTKAIVEATRIDDPTMQEAQAANPPEKQELLHEIDE